MKALAFVLKLQEPLLATQPHSGEANSRTSLSYIPGSMIRGAMIRVYQNSGRQVEPAKDECRSLFFDGTVCYLNAYPLHPYSTDEQIIRMLPTPKSWFTEKDKDNTESTLYNFAIKRIEDDRKWKSEEGSFCQINDSNTFIYEPKRQINIHNASDNTNQKTQGENQIFRYDAIAAGELFAAVIISEDDKKLEYLKSLLENNLFILGGSHTAGYGKVNVYQIVIESNWHEAEIQTSQNGKIILTLLSDAILRNPDNGCITTDLQKVLGLTESPISVFQRIALKGGFNRKWGLPLPQAWVIEAGSVFCFPQNVLENSTLKRLADRGIGERRVDGFGRIAANWHTEASYKSYQLEHKKLESPPQLSRTSIGIAQQMAQRMLRSKLEDGLINAIFVYQFKDIKQLPSRTQLSRVRLAARHAIQHGDLGKIIRHLKALKSAEEWKNARLDNTSPNYPRNLYEWIVSMAKVSQSEFRRIFTVANALPQIGGIECKITEELEIEYRARLIDGVMKFALEELKKEGE